MVKIKEYENKNGEIKKSISFSGMGDEEEIKLTLKMDNVYVGQEISGTKGGKAYKFTPHGIGCIYHKNGEEHDVWCNLNEGQAKKIEKFLGKGNVVIAYQKEYEVEVKGEKVKRDGVAFKSEGDEPTDDLEEKRQTVREYFESTPELAPETKLMFNGKETTYKVVLGL